LAEDFEEVEYLQQIRWTKLPNKQIAMGMLWEDPFFRSETICHVTDIEREVIARDQDDLIAGSMYTPELQYQTWSVRSDTLLVLWAGGKQ
jgi:hypothetical protein